MKLRVQRAEKLSAGKPTAGEPVPQVKSIMRSLRTRVGAPLRLGLLKYSPIQSGKVIPPTRSQRSETLASPVRS